MIFHFSFQFVIKNSPLFRGEQAANSVDDYFHELLTKQAKDRLNPYCPREVTVNLPSKRVIQS